MRKKEMPKMKKINSAILHSVIVSLLLFSFSVFTLCATEKEADGNQEVVPNTETGEIITVKVIPVVNKENKEKEIPKQRDFFSIAGIENRNDDFQIDLSHGNDIDFVLI